MKNKNSKVSLMKWAPVATGACIVASLFASQAASAAVADYKWPYNHATPVQFNITDLERSYASWKSARITANNAGGNGRYRVMGGVDDGSTVSEGIAYGMILTSIFDDQTEFDGLWLFAKDHFDNQGLMHWHIGNPGQLRGQGAATDGDVDMAIALVNACTKVNNNAWPNSSKGIDYCADATTIINNIYNHEVDLPGSQPATGLDNNLGYELMPGDQWYLQSNYPDGVVNHSYFPPAYFRVFGKFTGESQKWQRVIDRNYAMIDEVQAKSGNCSGLVPNWNKYNGDVQVVSWQPNNSGWWSYDAARFGWRIATDAMWYDSPDAEETASELGSFFASVGINNIGGEYQMNGQRTGNGANNFFIGNAASPIVAAKTLTAVSCGDASPTIKTTPQQAYDRTLAGGITPSDYYGAYWRLANMLLMTGNFPNLFELTGSGGSAPTVSMASPNDGDTFPSGSSVALAANASDDGQVSQVEFFIDGVSVGIDSSAPYALTVNNLSDGAHAIYADATDNDGLTSSSTAISISVGASQNVLPIAQFSAVTNGLMVNVDGAGSSDSDGSIQQYSWDFGDGTLGTGVTASHTYAAAGTYSVGLTVTDNAGGEDTATASVTVASNGGGGSSCSYAVSNEWSTGFVAEITITNNGSTAINGWSVNWSYSDGSTMTSGWNANYSGNNPYTASAFDWNGVINPGQSLSFGFQGSKGQANASAPIPTVSGAVCN